MRRGNLVEPTGANDFGKKAITLLTPQRLQIALAGAGPHLRQVYFLEVKRQAEPRRQLLDKNRVVPRHLAANAMLQMSDFEIQLQRAAQSDEQIQQRHRIRPAGYRNEKAGPRRQQSIFSRVLMNLLCQSHNSQIVSFPAYPVIST